MCVCGQVVSNASDGWTVHWHSLHAELHLSVQLEVQRYVWPSDSAKNNIQKTEVTGDLGICAWLPHVSIILILGCWDKHTSALPMCWLLQKDQWTSRTQFPPYQEDTIGRSVYARKNRGSHLYQGTHIYFCNISFAQNCSMLACFIFQDKHQFPSKNNCLPPHTSGGK